MYQLPREFGSSNGLAGLCISVYCVRLGVLWRFSGLVVMGVLIVWVAYMYIFLDQKFMYTLHLNQQFPRILTLYLHNKMRLNVNLHFVTLFML